MISQKRCRNRATWKKNAFSEVMDIIQLWMLYDRKNIIFG